MTNQQNAQNLDTLASGRSNSDPFITYFSTRDPTPNDVNYPIQKRWCNTDQNAEWILVSFTSFNGVLQANWQIVSLSDLLFLSGNSGGMVPADAFRNINVIGDTTTINIVGNPGTNTLTASTAGSVATSYVEDTGTATPALGILNVVGGSAITTSGSGNTVTISTTGTVATTYTADTGVAIPSGGNLNIFGTSAQGVTTSGASDTVTITNLDWTTTQKGVGVLSTNAQAIAGSGTTQAVTPAALSAKLGAQTLHGLPIGEGPTAALNWTAAPTNGQLLIGSTGNDPVLANITSTGGTVAITNGAGSINLEAIAVSGNTRFLAQKSASTVNATGDSTQFVIVCDRVLQNVGGGYNNATGAFTAPVTGLYSFTGILDIAGITASHIDGIIGIGQIFATNGSHSYAFNPANMQQGSGVSGLGFSTTQIFLLTAGEVVPFGVVVAGGAKTVAVVGQTGFPSGIDQGCWFGGFLIG